MLNQRQRFLLWATSAIVAIWLAAWAGRWYLASIKMTADKVQAYMTSVDFSKLTGDARAQALKALEDKLNALSYEERQRLRAEHLIGDWFAQMTEDEKSQFIDATMPTGFKQMIGAFEQLPEEKRRKMVDDALNNLRKANQQAANGNGATPSRTNAPVSPELEAKIRTIGLKSFYSQSSAETKAELAPVLEELQRSMETGTRLRRQ
ncbi:MAG TPA: hypothetical protein VH597_12250 [Verrucomicrobiae bacterium]|jgi:hypothetical protein|nr:hypothetical protein [Verrucomicrobiae bacterium]